MNKIHCMIDLETLDTNSSAIVLSLGAAIFRPIENGQEYDASIAGTFYTVLNMAEQRELGRTESESTLKWWSEQDAEASKVIGKSMEKTDALSDSLLSFNRWLLAFVDGSPSKVRMWGNGSDFDNMILSSLYDSVFGVTAAHGVRPWRFYNNRCFRTLRSIVPRSVGYGVEPKVAHHALYDAIAQAKVAAAMLSTVDERMWSGRVTKR